MSRKLGIQKAIANEGLLEQNSFAMTGWSYPIETLLISALKGPDSCVSIILKQDHVDRIAKQGNVVRANEWVKWAEIILPIKNLNKNYFKLPEESYLSLNEPGFSYINNVRLQIQSTTKINPHQYAVAFRLSFPINKGLFCSDSTYLGLQIPEGPQIRLTLPYTLVSGGILWMEIPVDAITDNQQMDIFLRQGEKVLANEKIRFSGGQFVKLHP